jgi:hypothetical protein
VTGERLLTADKPCLTNLAALRHALAKAADQLVPVQVAEPVVVLGDPVEGLRL